MSGQVDGQGDPIVPADPATVLAQRLREAAAERWRTGRDASEQGLEERSLNDLTALNNQMAGLQRELALRNQELADLNEWKITFLAMVAHDLRGPLTSIRGFAELLNMTLANVMDESQVEMTGQIIGAADRLRRMIDELMDASSLAAGKFVMKFEEDVDVKELIDTTLAMHHASAAYKGIDLEAQVEDELPRLGRGDPLKLGQVLANLVSNAIKYSHRDSRVVLSVGVEDDFFVFRVVDHGQGMTEEDLLKLFQPYGTTKVRATAGETSTGLGLSIALAIAEGHGGTVGITSEVDKGTTSTVRIPVSGPPPEDAEAEGVATTS